MSLEAITLPTNKTVTKVSNNRRTIRSGERGLPINVTVIDENDQPYDLTQFTVEFSELKDEGKVVFDDGTGDNGGNFNMIDAKNGNFEYVLAPQVYSASGRCWFVLKKGDTVIDTTKDFYFDVLKDVSINISNDNYVSSLNAQIAAFDAFNQRVDEEWKQKSDAIESEYTQYSNQLTALENNWKQQTSTIQQNADKQIADIKSKSDAQISADSNNAKQSLNNSIAEINKERDNAINQANNDFKSQRDSLTNQFNTWLNTTKQNYTADINDLKSQLGQVRNDISTITGTDVPAMDQKIKDLEDKIAQAEKDFSSVNFNDYAKKSDVYDKPTVDGMVAKAGKVKGLKDQPTMGWESIGPSLAEQVTDGHKYLDQTITPDSDGNLTLNVDDIIGYYSYVMYYMLNFFASYAANPDDDDAEKNLMDQMNQVFDYKHNQNAQYMFNVISMLSSFFATSAAVNEQFDNINEQIDNITDAGYAPVKHFKTDADAQKWSASNDGIAVTD